jgi:hypothetical protein
MPIASEAFLNSKQIAWRLAPGNGDYWKMCFLQRGTMAFEVQL